jgi:hypothetical protein
MHILMYEAGTKTQTKADIQTNNSRWDLILEVQKGRLKDKRELKHKHAGSQINK